MLIILSKNQEGSKIRKPISLFFTIAAMKATSHQIEQKNPSFFTTELKTRISKKPPL